MNTHQETAVPQTGKHWINGEWVHSATVAKSVNPSSGEALGQYSAGGRIEAAPLMKHTSISDERRNSIGALGLVTRPTIRNLEEGAEIAATPEGRWPSVTSNLTLLTAGSSVIPPLFSASMKTRT